MGLHLNNNAQQNDCMYIPICFGPKWQWNFKGLMMTGSMSYNIYVCIELINLLAFRSWNNQSDSIIPAQLFTVNPFGIWNSF